METIIFTVCGRAGSQGIRSKNIRNFLDVPLCYYTLGAIKLFEQRHPEYDVTIALNTDSEPLIGLFRDSSLDFIFVPRKEEQAGSTAAKIDVIEDTLVAIEHEQQKKFDYVVDLDITSPLRTIQDIENVIEKRKNSAADIVFTVAPSRRNPYFNMVMKRADGYYGHVIETQFTARQQAPECFDINASIYAYRPDFLRQQKAFNDGSFDIVLMRDTAVLDLDSEEDFEMMQVVAQYLFESDEAFGEIFETAQQLSFRKQLRKE